MEAGWGRRRIKNKLAQEKLCDVSDSSIGNVMQEINEEKKLHKDDINDDGIQRKADEKKLQEDKIQLLEREVKEIQKKDRDRKRRTELNKQKAETKMGLKQIFSSPQEVLEFTQQTVGESDDRYVLRDWRSFKTIYQNRNPSLDEGLFELVSLEEYEDYIIDGYVTLDNYIANSISDFLRERRVQKKFEEKVEQLICPICGKEIKVWIIGSGECYCRSCAKSFKLRCITCGDYLQFKSEQRVDRLTSEDDLQFTSEERFYHCTKCGITFKLPALKGEVSLIVIASY